MENKRQNRCIAKFALLLLGIVALPAWSGYKEGMDALAVRDYVRARAEFEQDRGEARAVYELARMARLGLGETLNEVRATSLLRTAAEMGHYSAKLDYAFALGNGRGVDKDPAQALQILETLSAEGKTEAQVALGRALRFGWWNQAKNEARAAELFQKAMEAGDDNGRLQYATALAFGVGLPKDEVRAAELLRQSSDRGHLESQLEYARWLTFGIGLPKDESAGTTLYRKTAESNNRVAQYALGMAYLRGRGVYRDDKTAVRWIDASARQGWEWAQLEMGDLFRLGTGVPRSRMEAYYWYSVAARGANSEVVSRANIWRADLARDMPQADLNRTVARAEAFRAQQGFRPRLDAFPPLARNDRLDLGEVNLRIPSPKGYVNGWQTTEWVQQAYPNDPDNLPWLMVLNNQEDVDRIKLGLGGGVRRVELSRHSTDDTITVTPKLFGEIKGQLKSQIQAAIAAGRYRSEDQIHDDETAFSLLRSGVTEPNRLDAVAFVLVKEKVLMVAFKGYSREQRSELADLVRGVIDEIKSANSPGFFSR